MELRELASHFDDVLLNRQGFRARCPAHDSHSQSLSVTRGRSSWLVKCFAGCSYTDVVETSGLWPGAFRFDTSMSFDSDADGGMDVRRRMATLISQRRRIPVTFEEIADIALQPPLERLAVAGARFPHLTSLSLSEAARIEPVVSHSPLWEMMRTTWQPYGPNWIEAKRAMWRLLWETHRIEQTYLIE